jgi:hypothetical protein
MFETFFLPYEGLGSVHLPWNFGHQNLAVVRSVCNVLYCEIFLSTASYGATQVEV